MNRAKFVIYCVIIAGSLSSHQAAADCTVSSTGISFGEYIPLSGGSLASDGTITVACSELIALTINYTINLSTGNGSYTERQMMSSGNPLSYNLYTNSGRSIVWGDGSGSTQTISDSFFLSIFNLSQSRDHPIYGEIFSSQEAAAVGSYSDLITITVDYD